jgi:catechol 2,3-dioxygenase-like lactoylglutathione lyase family enzyme
MIKVTKLGHVGFKTPDVARLLAYYTEVLGLSLVERGADGTVYLGSGVDHHAVVLYPASASHIDHIAFQIRHDLSLKEATAILSQAGVKTELQSDPQPGLTEVLQLADPDGYP